MTTERTSEQPAEKVRENQHLTAEQQADLEARLQAAIPHGIVIVPNIRFDFEGYAVFAVHVLHMRPQEALEWVMREFAGIVAHLGSLKPGDCILSAIDGYPPDHNEADEEQHEQHA